MKRIHYLSLSIASLVLCTGFAFAEITDQSVDSAAMGAANGPPPPTHVSPPAPRPEPPTPRPEPPVYHNPPPPPHVPVPEPRPPVNPEPPHNPPPPPHEPPPHNPPPPPPHEPPPPPPHEPPPPPPHEPPPHNPPPHEPHPPVHYPPAPPHDPHPPHCDHDPVHCGHGHPPVFHFPIYPPFGWYPAGPCVINENTALDSLYTVTNAFGQNIGETYDYDEAYQIAENAENAGECNFITFYTNPYPQPNFCQLVPVNGNSGLFEVQTSNGTIITDAEDYDDALSASQSDQRCYIQ